MASSGGVVVAAPSSVVEWSWRHQAAEDRLQWQTRVVQVSGRKERIKWVSGIYVVINPSGLPMHTIRHIFREWMKSGREWEGGKIIRYIDRNNTPRLLLRWIIWNLVFFSWFFSVRLMPCNIIYIFLIFIIGFRCLFYYFDFLPSQIRVIWINLEMSYSWISDFLLFCNSYSLL